MFIGGHMYHVALPDWLRDGKCQAAMIHNKIHKLPFNLIDT